MEDRLEPWFRFLVLGRGREELSERERAIYDAAVGVLRFQRGESDRFTADWRIDAARRVLEDDPPRSGRGQET